MKAPCVSQCRFCAERLIQEEGPKAFRADSRAVKGGARTTSALGDAGTRSRRSRMRAAASEAVLFIFQLPMMRGLRTGLSVAIGGVLSATMRLRGSIREGGQARELFAFEHFQDGGGAGRHERHIIRLTGSMHGQ